MVDSTNLNLKVIKTLLTKSLLINSLLGQTSACLFTLYDTKFSLVSSRNYELMVGNQQFSLEIIRK